MTEHDPKAIVTSMVDADGNPVTRGRLQAEITAGLEQIVGFLHAAGTEWLAEHDPEALLARAVGLGNTLVGYSVPMLIALVEHDAEQARIDAVAATIGMTIPDEIPADLA